MSFFEELKRRNVFRIGIAYLITGWVLLQVVDLVLENISSPDWVMQAFMLAVGVGFPITLLVAWAFEMTPDGLKKEKDVDRTSSITHVTGRKLDRAIIGILIIALGYFVFDKFGADSGLPQQQAGTGETLSPESEQSEPSTPDRKSIAVLPFANRSSREEDAYFADGIHDDLLTSLAKVGSLKVISRTSVMRYRGSGLSIPEIAAELGVTTVLEGGIQRSGEQVRINVQLIDASSDEHLWAENYDRALSAENLFAIQSEISREIVTALKTTLTEEEIERLTAQPTALFNLSAFLLDEKFNIDVQLQAAESTGNGKVVSSPRVVTMDNSEAMVEQGVSIPFQTFENGDAKLEFVDAVLSLRVTPHITADKSIIMEIEVTRDAPDSTVQTPTGSPAIAKNQAKTETLVKDAQTLVLGGIYSGLVASDADLNVVVACDMPFLCPELIGYMLEQAPGYDAVIPRLEELVEPLHAIYARSSLAPIEDKLKAGRLGVHKLFSFLKVRYVERDEVEHFDPDCRSFFNVNTEADLKTARRITREVGL